MTQIERQEKLGIVEEKGAGGFDRKKEMTEEDLFEEAVITKKKELKVQVNEVEVNTKVFNPFSSEERKKEEESEKPLKPRRVINIKK